MKLTFISNYYNHHQKYLSDSFYDKCFQFDFIATSEMREERKKMGYNLINIPSYVCQYKSDVETMNKRIDESDVAIIGSAPHSMVRKRINDNKIVFKYSERPIRKKERLIEYFPRFIKWHIKYPNSKMAYILCASAFTSYDFNKYHLFRNKAYKWGYFPKTIKYDIENIVAQKNKKEILWCGRFLDLKHPEEAILAAYKLKNSGYEFTMRFIGSGEIKEKMCDLVEEKGLGECISFEGTVNPEAVRMYMEKAGIFLFTSDYREGWGVVLNEAMNAGCAVIASHAIGSVPYLIQHYENGLIYKSGSVDELYSKIKKLLDDVDMQETLGEKAYQTIITMWNAEIAAERFLNLANHILEGDKFPDLYEEGPCSKAEILSDDWFE